MGVETKRQKKGTTQRNETQRHVLPDGRIMVSAKGGVLGACGEGDMTVVRKLLEDGEAVNKYVDRHGSTALHWAAGGGHVALCTLLLDTYDDDYMRQQNKDGRNALHWAARNGRVEVMQLLLQRGEDINSATHSGNTALHWAIWGSQLEGCRWLMAAGSDLHLENATQCTAVHWAAAKGDLQVCKYLHSLGADFAKINSAGHGVVTKAAWEGHSEVVFWALDTLGLGAQLSLRDVHDSTTEELARQNGHTDLADNIQKWKLDHE